MYSKQPLEPGTMPDGGNWTRKENVAVNENDLPVKRQRDSELKKEPERKQSAMPSEWPVKEPEPKGKQQR